MKDTVLRRELASIALATRKTNNFFRGMLSTFRAGVSVVVGFHGLAAWSYALFSLRGLD